MVRAGRWVVRTLCFSARSAIPLALCLLSFVAVAQEDYAWPLDLPRVVTGTFGEYRGTRYHAGLDLRTNGVGRDVHAPASGQVVRVRCSPFGYGKAVYLRLEDGNTAIFAHLDDYMPSLRDYVREAQHRAHKYAVDLYPEAGRFPVKRGEIIAKSGESGVGVPHLHYELRNGRGHPFNHRLTGVEWPDTTRPVVRKLLVAPEVPASRVGSGLRPLVRGVKKTAPGEYVAERVTASGRVGFGVDVIDPANGGATILGVYRVRTLVNGGEVFCVQKDEFSYDTLYDGLVSVHPFFKSEGRFSLQWRWPGNDSIPYARNAGDGWIDVPPEPSEVRIEAVDYLGNASALTFVLCPEDSESPVAPTGHGEEEGRVSLAYLGGWFLVEAAFPAAESDAPRLEINDLEPLAGNPFLRAGSATFQAGIWPSPQDSTLSLRVNHPRLPRFEKCVHVFHRGAPARTALLGEARVEVAPESPYGTLFVEEGGTRGAQDAPIPVAGATVSLLPDTMPLDEDIKVALPFPEGEERPERLGIYRQKGRSWDYLTTSHEGGWLVASSGVLGTFAVLRDDQAPRISSVEVSGEASAPRPAIRAKVSDVGSGIDTISVMCNGQWLLFAYDPEGGRISWEQDEDLPAGPRTFVFTVTDHAGNEARITR